jgi:PAS domain S-box-containing protein|nr:ATP-binding protein [Candidatus Krumholzibacteria bacterium]
MDQDDFFQLRAQIVALGFEENAKPMLLLDPAGHIVLASDGAGILLGQARADLVGRYLGDYLLLPDEFRTCRDTISADHGPREMEVRHSQGEIIPVEVRCSHFEVDPITASSDPGDRAHLFLHLTDVRQREIEDQERASRLAKLSLLNQVSEALYGAHATIDQILQAVLICITAGEGLRFNRAFLLLIDQKNGVLQGEIAIGPSNADEASRIWLDLAGKPGDLFDMMTSYDRSIKKTDVAVNEIVRHMVVPLDDTEHAAIAVMKSGKALSVTADMAEPGMATLRHWLGCQEFAMAPLTTRRGPLGVIVADNAISHAGIHALDLEFLQLFANQSAGAIENSRLYHELERRLLDLRKAHEQQKKDQTTLLRMERLSVMGETSAIVAHELRNPLVAIGGFARTLVRNLKVDDPNRQFAKIISEEVARMEDIIHDLLDFIRPRKQMRKTVVIDQLITETVDRYLEEFAKNKIRLVNELGAGQTALNCHPGEIQQVLRNYLMNAIQVMPAGGELIVRSEVLEGGVKVSVLDSGPGFANDVAEKLFSPFFSTKASGSGLGLTICAQVLKAHGGVVGASNRTEGGADFSFILPLPKEADGE